MKLFFVALILLTILSCKEGNPPSEDGSPTSNSEKTHKKLHEEMDSISIELGEFREELINHYVESENNPDVVIAKIDSLLEANKTEKNKYKSQLKRNIDNDLHYFKAELLYKLGRYNESLRELNFDDYRQGDIAAAYAANYVKLEDHKTAKLFIDRIGKGYYIYDYSLANYYECIGDKKAALTVYNLIKQDKSIKHYAYYKLAVKRLEELEKNSPRLLNEIYFPTGNPSFNIAESDSENRTKIFELMETLPENQPWNGTKIVESPQENGKNYYLVSVQTKDQKEFNYYVYQETFEIRFFDDYTNKIMTLEEWRKSR